MSSLKLESWEEGEAGALEVPPQWRLSEAFVPRGRYIDPEFLALELERLFPRTWLNACRADEVERVGQYVNFEIGGESVVVVRTEEGLRAYFNACRHRGTRLVQGQGRIGEFRCPFHAWRWNLDGSLKFQADAGNFDPRPADELCLPECRVDTWGGWVFINMDGRAEPLADYLAPLPERLDGFKLEDMRIAWYKSVILPANWKTSLDAFVESWHVPGTHPQLLRPDKHHSPPTIAESATVRRHVQRAVPLPLAPRRHLPLRARRRHHQAARRPTVSTREPSTRTSTTTCASSRALYLKTDLGAAEELLSTEGADGPSGNAIYQQLRKKHARAAGIDCPDLTDDQLKYGMYDWHVFPNTVFLLDMGCCLTYRARPNGNDPDSCIFDVQGLELPPAAGLPTALPQFFEDWRAGDVGEVLTQDFSNMSEVTAGLHSRHYDGHRLNTTQEMTIWNYHRAIDGFLFE